jgi:AmiR/NasT family two-component response regulator
MLKSLREIRSLRVLIVHPKDRDGDALAAQIGRIGCAVQAVWPPQTDIPPETSILFVLFREDALTGALLKALASRDAAPTLIGIVESESPFVIEAVARVGTSAVITKPVRSFGLLTTMVIAHGLAETAQAQAARIGKLESRLACVRQIEHAKSILMSRKSISEQEAYEMIRAHAMARRLTMEAVSTTIIEASAVLG